MHFISIRCVAVLVIESVSHVVFLTASQFWHHLLNKIFWQNKMLFRPTIPSFFQPETWNTHIFFGGDKVWEIRPKYIWQVSNIWAASWQNQQNGMCAQRGLRSAWVSAQSDQSLHCPHEHLHVIQDAQADLSLRLAHSHFVGFFMWRLICALNYILLE